MMGGPNAKMMRDLQARMAKIQEELAEATVEATAGGGAVKVVMTGQQQVRSVTLDPDAVDPDDVEMLQDLVVAAVNEAMSAARRTAEQKMAAVTGGMRLPGM